MLSLLVVDWGGAEGLLHAVPERTCGKKLDLSSGPPPHNTYLILVRTVFLVGSVRRKVPVTEKKSLPNNSNRNGQNNSNNHMIQLNFKMNEMYAYKT